MLQFDTVWQARLHKPTAAARLRTIAGLYEATRDADPYAITEAQQAANKLREKIIDCGRYSCVYEDDDSGELVIGTARCKSRICPRCRQIRANHLRASIEKAVENVNAPKLLTLTPEHTDEPIRAQVKHLRESFARLRRTKRWKLKVRGGVSVIEIKWSYDDNRWHPHLHCLIDADWWDQADIVDHWRVATGGAFYVHIKPIHDRRKSAHYVTKYITKTGENDDVPFERIAEHAIGIHGLRLVSTFGTLHGQVRESAAAVERGELSHVALLGPVATAAGDGDVRARRAMRAVLLAARLCRTDDDGRLDRRDEHRSREAAVKLRAWEQERQNHDHHETPQQPPPKPRSRGPSDRTLRLWQEPDAAPTALEHGI